MVFRVETEFVGLAADRCCASASDGWTGYAALEELIADKNLSSMPASECRRYTIGVAAIKAEFVAGER